MRKLIVRNLLWTLVISVALAAILMVVVFIGDGYPLRVLVVMVILVPVMAAIVTFLTLQIGKPKVVGSRRRARVDRGHYSGSTYYYPGLFVGDATGDSGGGDYGSD